MLHAQDLGSRGHLLAANRVEPALNLLIADELGVKDVSALAAGTRHHANSPGGCVLCHHAGALR